MGLSTHILDTALGRPAAHVEVILAKRHHDGWSELARGVTDADGRCRTLLGEHGLEAATYKLSFLTDAYFRAQKLQPLYPFVDIAFDVREPASHYHIPLLLTANGFTTYRGT